MQALDLRARPGLALTTVPKCRPCSSDVINYVNVFYTFRMYILTCLANSLPT